MAQRPIVKEVTEFTMDGNSPLEKKLNACITRCNIGRHDLPADECLNEAIAIIAMLENATRDGSFDIVRTYIHGQFGTYETSLNKDGTTEATYRKSFISIDKFDNCATEIVSILQVNGTGY